VPSHDAEEFGGTLYHELVALTETAWNRWIHALEQVPPVEMATPGVCGSWSVKDLLGHIALCDDIAVQKIGALGGTPPAELDENVDDVNNREAALRADRSVEEQWAEMRRNHDRLLGALEAASRASDDDLERVRRWIAGDTWEHYDEHTAQVSSAYPVTH
jgi:uncharacterized damage-inducible protein DinB